MPNPRPTIRRAAAGLFAPAAGLLLAPAAGLLLALAAGLLLALAAGLPARADDMPVVKVEMRDGLIIPSVIEVPAKVRFKLEISNTGTSPAEFESAELKREKALAAGSTSAIVFRTLDPGSYDVFDDFHPGAKATLVAK